MFATVGVECADGNGSSLAAGGLEEVVHEADSGGNRVRREQSGNTGDRSMKCDVSNAEAVPGG